MQIPVEKVESREGESQVSAPSPAPYHLYEAPKLSPYAAAELPSKLKFYAVAHGRHVGVFTSWAVTQAAVSGFSGAVHKSFRSYEEALEFVAQYQTVANDDCYAPQIEGSSQTRPADAAEASASTSVKTEPCPTCVRP